MVTKAPTTPTTSISMSTDDGIVMRSGFRDTGARLTVVTFNMLSPPYHEVNGTAESRVASAWQARLKLQLRMILETGADVVSLQEYWFTREFRELVVASLSERYNIYEYQRTGRKQDGVALCIAKHLTVVDQHQLNFRDSGNRVMLTLHMRMNTPDERTIDFLLCATHLTFPHHSYDIEMRLGQARCITRFLNEWPSDLPIVLTGDFNGKDDNVYEHLTTLGFVSSHMEGSPPSSDSVYSSKSQFTESRPVSRTETTTWRTWQCVDESDADDEGDDVSTQVDYVWLRTPRSPIASPFAWMPVSCVVLPAEHPSDKWPLAWNMSDHRPVFATLALAEAIPEEGVARL